VVDEHSARFHTGKCAVLTEDHAAQVVVVAHAGGHDIGVAHGFGRGGRMTAAIFLRPLLCFGRRAVVDGDRVTGALQMTGHGIPHDAQTEKGDTNRLDGFGGGSLRFGGSHFEGPRR
jgi:hypothetical protein